MKKFFLFISILLIAITVGFSQSNPSNPYDYVGQMHNEILDTYVKYYGSKSQEIPAVCASIDSIAARNPSYVSKFGTPTKSSVEIVSGLNDDFKNQFSNVISNLGISAHAKSIAQGLINHMFDIAVTNDNTPYEDFYQYVVKLEDDISKDDGLTTAEREILLSGTSVARYSGKLWYSNTDFTYSVTRHFYRYKRKWWQWAIIGVADVGGVIAGAYVNPGVAVTAGSSASGFAYTATNPNNK